MTLRSTASVASYEVPAISAVYADVARVNLAAFEGLRAHLEEKGATRNYLLLGVLVIVFHGVLLTTYQKFDTANVIKPQKHEIEVQLFKPVIEPPPIDQPKPPPPPQPPKLQHEPPKPPQPTQSLRTQPAEQNIAPSDLTVAENTNAAKSTGPVASSSEPTVVAPPAPPAPPAPKAEDPVTEVPFKAAFLDNPMPKYPAIADREGWSGTVMLDVLVQANGHVKSVDIVKSSGHKVLDDAAAKAVKDWLFKPAKRGNTPIDRSVTFPFKWQLGQ